MSEIEPVAHLVILPTKDAGPTTFFTAPSDDRGFAVYHQSAINALQARIAELEADIAGLQGTMMAAAVEIQEHWQSHCDADGYGPANLMRRLEHGIDGGYGYSAKTVVEMNARLDEEVSENAALKTWVRELEAALGEIAWSTDSKWQADRARAAAEIGRTTHGTE